MTIALLPTFLMAVLACWLGISLLVRSPRDLAAQAFACLCANLVLYSTTALISSIPHNPQITPLLNRLQLFETAFLPPLFLYFIILVAQVRRWYTLQIGLLILTCIVSVCFSAYALLGNEPQLSASPPRFPAGWLTVLWLLLRFIPLIFALVLTAMSYAEARNDDLERRRRALFAIAAVIAVSGALWATITRASQVSQAPGHLLMDAGMALMAYTVLAYRLMLPARLARRTFFRSLFGGLFTALYVILLLWLETRVKQWLGIDFPLITVFALTILVAMIGPLRDVFGDWIDRRFFYREFDYGRLLRSFGSDLFERGELADKLQAALSNICNTLGVNAGIVAVSEAQGLRILSSYGQNVPDPQQIQRAPIPERPQIAFEDWHHWPEARLILPLRIHEQVLGLLVLSPKRSGEPYRETERAVLDMLANNLAREIRHARARQEEEISMAALAQQAEQLRLEQEQLAVRAEEVSRMREAPAKASPSKPAGMHVYALGPLRAERDGEVIERWGGDKAGTYQAEALFAFLFDRRGRGLTKDEAGELIWPDLDMEKADSAFHRTVSGLRRTLEPGLKRASASRIVTYHHERYWLDPNLVTWCDADEFATAAERAHTLVRKGDLEAAREVFVQALALYRGDYMDDCPFFGDSTYVEERRTELREQRIAMLLSLGQLYEQLDQVGEAAACYRRALHAADGDNPRAVEALERLGMQ